MGFVIIYITHQNEDEAKKVTTHLLDRRLIACANLFPIQSSYWWEGKIAAEAEVVSIVKTRSQNWEKVKAEVKKVHPYKVPCIMKLDVQADEEYEAWIHAETQ